MYGATPCRTHLTVPPPGQHCSRCSRISRSSHWISCSCGPARPTAPQNDQRCNTVFRLETRHLQVLAVTGRLNLGNHNYGRISE